MLQLDIKIEFDSKDLAVKFFKSIEPELKEKYSRSEIKFHLKNEKLCFDINANDKTAMRATLNSIMKPLILFEKLGGI